MGILGVLIFVLSIILDGIFHVVALEMLELNIIALLQRYGIGFEEVGKIEQRDQVLQVLVIRVGVSLMLVIGDLSSVGGGWESFGSNSGHRGGIGWAGGNFAGVEGVGARDGAGGRTCKNGTVGYRHR